MDIIPVIRVALRAPEGLLILRRANSSNGNGLYCLPGGKHDQETMLDTIVEETAQETGITVGDLMYGALSFHYLRRFGPMTSHTGKTYQEFFLEASMPSLERARIRLDNENSDCAIVNARNFADHPYAFDHDIPITETLGELDYVFQRYLRMAKETSLEAVWERFPRDTLLTQRLQTAQFHLSGNLIDGAKAKELDRITKKGMMSPGQTLEHRKAYWRARAGYIPEDRIWEPVPDLTADRF